MATDVRSLPTNLADDATFRAWGSGIAAQLAACGLVQTSDSGQINWTTATRPPVNGSAGYEIYRFNDAQQAAWPVYFKLEYGSGNTLGGGRLGLTVGTGTNGAGVITGQAAPLRFTYGSAALDPVGTTRSSYASGDGGRIVLLNQPDASQIARGTGFVIERARSGSGAVTQPIFVMMTATSGMTTWAATVIHPSGAVPAFAAASSASPTDTLAQASVSTRVAVVPLMIVSDGAVHFVRLLVYPASAIAAGFSSFSAAMFGASRAWMPTTGVSSSPFSSAAGDRAAFLWE